MSPLNDYLARHYLNEDQLASASAAPAGELDALVREGLVPGPSYVVAPSGTVRSHVFGEMAAPGATPGRYFHPSQSIWIARAREALALGRADAAARLEQRFRAGFAGALAALDRSTWRLRDCFDDEGQPIGEGLRQRTEDAWKYFLNGTFGLCVANPVSEAHIAHKEVLQEKLAHLSDNGTRSAFPAAELAAMRALVEDYAAAAMPFSPVEYPLSSRKRLVEDLGARLHAAG